MNPTCSFTGNPVLKSLQNFCGADVAKYLEYFSKVFTSDPQVEQLEAKADFAEWYKKNYKKDLDLNSIGSISLKNAIVKYYDEIVPTYSASEVNINISRAAMFGYTSPLARKVGLKYLAMLIYKDYMNIERTSEEDFKRNILSEVASDNLRFVRDELATMLSEGLSDEEYEEIWNNLGSNCGEYLDGLIRAREADKNSDPYSNTVLNWMALYRELTSTFKETPDSKSGQDIAFDELFNSKLITSLQLSKYDTLDDVLDADNMSLNSVESDEVNDPEEAGNEDKVDTTIRDHGLHHGELDDFKKHLSERIKRILNTIPKLNSPVPRINNSTEKVEDATETPLDLKIDSEIGFPEYLDSTEVATILYSYVVKDDADSMAESIRVIAETFPEYAGLSILANMLQQDRDLRYSFYTNFGKHIVSKAQTVLNDGAVTYRISNPNASRLDTLKTEYRNEFIVAATNVNMNDINSMFDRITTSTIKGRTDMPVSRKTGKKMPKVLVEVEDEVGRTHKVEKAIEKIYNILKIFYPTLNKNSVINFVCNNSDMSIQEAMASLYDDAKKAVNTAESVQVSIKRKQDGIKSTKDLINHMLWKNKMKKANHTTEEFTELRNKLKDLYTEDPVKPEMLASPTSFAEHMLKYALIKTNLNSVNVHGNQSSDILNSSLITRLKSIFENPDRGAGSPLQLLAEDYHLDTNTQFRLSNLLIEQDDHPGIFRLVNGKYVPTEYANDLLQFTLFNGAINQDTETPVLYSEMSKGDYIGTSWANFFSETDSTIPGRGIKLGRYFLRIPSDAPKTFILRAPRYMITKENPLFTTGNQEEFNQFVTNVVNRLTQNNITVPGDALATLAKDAGSVLIEDDEEFANHILSTGEQGIDVGEYVDDKTLMRITKEAKKQEGETTKILFVKKNSDGTVIPYIMEGTFKGGYLYKAKFVNFFNTPNTNENLRNIIENHYNDTFINDGTVTYDDLSVTRVRVVNRNHQLFRQLKNAFKQELLDGVAAARLMFKTDVLKVKNEKGKEIEVLVNGKPVYRITRDSKLNPVLQEKWAADLNGLSPIYHFRGQAYKDGKLTGRVFESDRFIIFDENDNVVRNFGQELLDSTLKYLTTNDNPSTDTLVLWSEVDGIPELNLTSKQETAIETKLDEYINMFVDNSYQRIQQTKDFMKGRRVNIDNVADYMLNHQLVYIESNELLEGDTKYYKDVQTFLKRTKEYQASGNPYGIASIRRTLTSSPLEKIQIGPASWNITLSDRFNAVTFKTTKMFKKAVLDNLEKVLSNKKIMGDHAMSKHDAHILMYGIDGKGGYTDAKVNDAQSYITFEEWVRRVAARGELYKYTPLINKIINNEALTKDDLKEFIQVQKNVYYDMYYDQVTGRVVPRQIKNAEFVLVPQFIEGTELAEVYKFMKDNNIDQLNTDETSKASNNYIVEIFDDNGVLKQEIVNNNNPEGVKDKKKAKAAKDYKDLINKAIQPYSYNYLYEQQKTPQHMFANNKFAIQIAKKIIDNIQKDHPLYAEKMRYFDLMTTNIKQSFISLMKEFNIPVDENGNIQATDATIFENIDYEKFYDKLKVELGRLGLDDNSLDYATLTGNPYDPSETVMPNYFCIMINKLESIVQSLVTKAVTRQTLHGFHAAQISNIGYVELGHKNTIKGDKSLKYHPEGYYNPTTNKYVTIEQYNNLEDKTGFEKATLPWAEVKLPYSAFGIDKNSAHYKNMTDKEIIAELEAKGLDKFIGYRIPTEGKQSISVMKLTGFIHDVSGSTIVLPNEWVPQTGSDYDIDSVYGIMHKVIIDGKGEVHRIEYKKEFTTADWFKYVSRESGDRIEGMTTEEFNNAKTEAKEKAKAAVQKYREELQAIEQEAYNNLPGKYFTDKETKKPVYIGPKGGVVKVHHLINEEFGSNSSREKYEAQLRNEIDLLNRLLENNTYEQDEIDAVKDYLEIITTIHNSLTEDTTDEGNLYKDTKNEHLSKTIEKFRELRHKAYANLAEINGLMSEEEFLNTANSNPMDYNTRNARDNEIVNIMIEIMSHPYSLEENLSRSNFDNITGNDNAAVDKLRNPIEQTKRKNRSPFNILDEAEFQEDAMQGFALKGFSVARDTFCSICNTVRPTISDIYAPVVEYDFSELSDKEFDKKLKELKERFDDGSKKNVVNKGKIVHIRHNKIGWSNNGDKNIDGKYITVYSSQTTAHILDAMKSGPVPNVNKYTFGVYKTLVDVGSRYETAIGFIMHPAVAVINKYYNRTNSIYASDTSTKYIESAINEYCDKLASIPESKVKFKKRASLSEKLQAVSQAYGVSISLDYMNNNLTAISEKDLQLRIKDEDAYRKKVGGEEQLILHDMAHVLHFAKIAELTNHISSVQQVTNPDKFGAKQTIFETEKVFKNIADYIKSQYVWSDERKAYVNQSVLSVNGKDILESIYPDFVNISKKNEDEFDNDMERFVRSTTNVKRSTYPTLCAHIKYGSATSIIVNKTFFVTQTPGFRTLINSIEKMFSDNKRLNEKTYKELRTYLINALYRRAGFINSTLAYKKGEGFKFKDGDVRVSNDAEYARIYGYSRGTTFEVPIGIDEESSKIITSPVEIKNVSDPTQEEIDMFAALSPAQKIEFLKKRFKNKGSEENIFDYINTRLYTTTRTRNTSPGAQLISFAESSADIDYLRTLFFKAFTNSNPLIALTAADIIKYAFVVDGYQFTRNGVSKLIPDSLLINDGPYTGTNIVPDVNERASRILMYLDDTNLENFIRSHPNLSQINTRRVQKHGNMYELNQRHEDMIFITPSDKETAVKYGIAKPDGNSFNSYVRLKYGDDTILYKIWPFEDGYCILTPLNALERNENAIWSANDNNNIYPGKVGGYDYFEEMINNYKISRQPGERGFAITTFEKLIDETTANDFKAISYVVEGEASTREFDIKAETATGQNLINRATEIVNDPNKPYRYFYSLSLDNYIEEGSNIMVAIPTKMKVKGEEVLGAPHIFRISPVDISGLYKYFAKPSLNRSDLSEKSREILKSLETEMQTRSISAKFSHMFEIEEVKENLNGAEVKRIKFSTIGHKPKPIVSATMSVIDGVNYMGQITGEERSSALARGFNQQHIFSREKVAEAHVEDVIVPAAKAVEEAVNNIEDSLNQFWEIPGQPNHYYKITDPEVVKEIKHNTALREKYLKAIMDPAAIESKFAIFRDLDIESEDEIFRPYLKKIKDSVAKLRTIPAVRKAQENYVYEVLDKLSDNPYIGGSINGAIGGGLISVISGFYKQSTLNALFNDIQESPNALVQVTMKMIQSNLRATEMQTERDIAAFTAHIEDIKKRAADAGKTINWDNIVDEYGRFRRKYKDELIKDRERLQHRVDDAKQHWVEVRDSKPNNELSVESVKAYLDYQRAELEYNEWKAKYIEQEAINTHNNNMGIEDDGYYNTKNKLARQMIDGAGTKYIYAVYQILRDKRNRLMRKQLDDIDNPDLEAQIEDIKTKLYHLSQTFLQDPVTFASTAKTLYTGIDEDPNEMIRRAWDDRMASDLLSRYIKDNAINERKYWKYAPKAHFEQLVRDNLAIVKKYENPDENGIPKTSAAELANIPEYQKAKRWLRRNASPIYIERGEDSWLTEYAEAMRVLHDTPGAISPEYQKVYNNPDYRDENGDLNGLEISKDAELVKKIKEDQELTYNVFREEDFSDRKLISLAPIDDNVYTEEYWTEMLGAKDPTGDMKKEYKDTITAINNILSPYYSERTNSIDWARLFQDNTEEQIMQTLVALDMMYTRLEEISKGSGATRSKKEIAEWIADNCVTTFNEAQYTSDLLVASTMPNNQTTALFKKIIQGHSKDDTIGNSYLYKSFKIKHEEGTPEYKKYVDVRKTNARRTAKKYAYRVNTKYYTMAREDALSKGKAYFKDWFFKNHIYNPYERRFEPIAIWRKTEINTDVNSDIEVEWNAGYAQTNRVVRDGYGTLSDIAAIESIQTGSSGMKRKYITDEEADAIKNYREEWDFQNKNYKQGFGHGENYKYGSNSAYDNPDPRNEFEKDLADYVQGVMSRLVEDEQSQHFIKRGYLPSRAKGETFSAEFLGREAKKLLGFTYYDNGKDEETPIIDYAHDKYIPTPMLGFITKNYKEKNPYKKPIREECESEEEYLEKKRKWDAEEARIKAEELEIHKAEHDRDYEGVLKQFIAKANKHNSIQHNKMNFYMAQQLLSEYGVYRQRYGKEGDFKKDGRTSDAEQAEYLRQVDKDMLEQFTTTIQRFVNNEWKSPEGSLTRYMSMLQAMTSAKFMILNHKGGVANVTYGEASIHSESMAREFFGERESIKGLKMYGSGIIDYMSHMYSDKSSTLAGAIVKYMDVVDYDEQRGLNYIQDDLAEVSRRINDFAYSAQSAGEHAMQNRTMFAMMESHRLFVNPRHNEFGQPKYIYMNLHEYMQGLEESALMELLDETEKKEYKAFKKKITEDANKFKDYAWFREDFVTNYVQARFSWARQSEFNRLKKDRIENAEKEFRDDVAHPTIISQLKLGDDGKLAFREGTWLAEMDGMYEGQYNENGTGPSDALRFLANFKGRVIAVNKKIHGAYDKSGRAKIENTWWGSVVMQYHKHLPIGFAKRYRSKGYYNEERGAVEKGSYISILDFIKIPIKKHQTILNLTNEEVDAVQGVQNLMKEFLDFVFHARIAYNTMPEYDKANFRRACADFQAMFSALFACVALKMAASDDDKNRWWYNFALYQTDRLASESAQYMPWVLPSEAKKFFGNPIAGFKEVDDMLGSASALCQMIMGTVGLSDFEPIYESGPNAGRYKLSVYIERNIPFWRGIRSAYIDINDNNKAYKVSKNIIGFIDADKIAEKGKDLLN